MATVHAAQAPLLAKQMLSCPARFSNISLVDLMLCVGVNKNAW